MLKSVLKDLLPAELYGAVRNAYHRWFSRISSWNDSLLAIGPLRRAWRTLNPLPLREDAFLLECRSIIHVGANAGQERFLYESLGLKVIWIEPISAVFETLRRNIRGFRNQIAIRALAADVSGRVVTFNVANNGGASSSMFLLAEHKKIWPDVHFVETIELETSTLDELIPQSEPIDALVLDTQGAELLVLQGARRILRDARFVKAEAADFLSYYGGATLEQLTRFLSTMSYEEINRVEFAAAEGAGRYYDVTFAKRSPASSCSER